jgi:hypothetical protein
VRFFFLALFCSGLFAQTALTVEATDCVHTKGDDPAWAKPDFDDRGWTSTFPRVGNPYTWSRCRLDLRPLAVGAPFHLLVQAHGAWELYVDGALAASFGDIRNGRIPFNVFGQGVLTAPTEKKDVVIALRRFSLFFGSELLDPRLRILAGAGPAIQGVRTEVEWSALQKGWPRLLFAGLAVIAGLLLLILFLSDRKQPELLWFGLMAVTLGFLRLLFIPGQAFAFEWLVGAWTFLNGASPAFPIWFFYSLVGKRAPRPLLALVLVRAGFILYLSFVLLAVPQEAPSWFGADAVGLRLTSLTGLLLITLPPLAAFWPIWRIPPKLYWVAAASLLWTVGSILNWLPQLGLLPVQYLVEARNVQAWLATPALLAMFITVSMRIRGISMERAELQSELQAAQEVQRLLTSSMRDTAPWAQVEVAYLPAKVVGGDFYYCRQTAEGQLVVIGDVSGKGLRAAMLASAALGALRHSAASAPDEVLTGLNRALAGQTGGGFVTCCCVLLSPSGVLTIANAGHLAPYAGGAELSSAQGLPLGVVADACFETARIELKADASVTLVSDGVVEAANANGELFGFDRTAAISGNSAQEIAEAARAWGQNDDITVVTVRRTGA